MRAGMTRTHPLVVALLLLISATARAHDPSFTAVWFQPFPALVTGGHVLSFGGTKGVVPGLDVTAELTGYEQHDDACGSTPGCRDHLNGWIATAGVAWLRTIGSGPGWEAGGFVAPKVLWATAVESGNPGGIQPPPQEPTELPFAPGRATELGVGIDVGIEVHGAYGVYAAFLLGVHVSRVFNYGDFPTSNESYSSGSATPTDPVRLLPSRTSGTRHDGVEVRVNLNLVRVGINFDLLGDRKAREPSKRNPSPP
jgi:hypothetical protein